MMYNNQYVTRYDVSHLLGYHMVVIHARYFLLFGVKAAA